MEKIKKIKILVFDTETTGLPPFQVISKDSKKEEKARRDLHRVVNNKW